METQRDGGTIWVKTKYGNWIEPEKENRDQFVIEKCGVHSNVRYLQDIGLNNPVYGAYSTAWKGSELDAEEEIERIEDETGLYVYKTMVERKQHENMGKACRRT